MTKSDQIRSFVISKMIEPARERHDTVASVACSDVHTGLKLENRYPLVCSAIDAEKFLDQAHVKLVSRQGPPQSSTVVWMFSLE